MGGSGKMASNSRLETMAGAVVASAHCLEGLYPFPPAASPSAQGLPLLGKGGRSNEAVLVGTVGWYSGAQGNMNYFFYFLFLSKMESKR